MKALRAISTDDREAVVTEIVAAIEAGKPNDSLYFRHDREDVVEKLRAVAELDELASVEKIADAVESVQLEEAESE